VTPCHGSDPAAVLTRARATPQAGIMRAASILLTAPSNRSEVEINSDGRAIRLRCRDDGQGIELEMLKSKESNNHLGHLGMRERAKKIGATFQCRSAPGQGTEITVTLPGRLEGSWGTLSRLMLWRRSSAGVAGMLRVFLGVT
jgi:hypothetical protein